MKSKALKVLSASAALATVVAPVASTAFAATYSATSVQSISNGVNNANLGKVQINFNASELATSGDFVILTLPSDYNFNLSGTGTPLTNGSALGTAANGNTAPSTIEVAVGDNFLTQSGTVGDALTTAKNAGHPVTADVLSNNQVRINFDSDWLKTNAVAGAKAVASLYVNLTGISVNGASNGPVNLTVEGKAGGAFNSGSLTVANVGSGSVATSIDSVKTITSGLGKLDAIRIKEDRPGVLTNNGTDKIKYKLPDGFVWGAYNPSNGTTSPLTGSGKLSDAGVTVTDLAGNSGATLSYSIDDNGRTLYIKNTGSSNTSVAGYWMLQNLGVVINDETVAKQGDVDVAISGKGSVSTSNSDAVMAKYGDYSVKVYGVGDPKTVGAGMGAVKVGSFAIEEGAPNSLIAGRTVTLTLEGNAKWTRVSTSDALTVKDLTVDNAQSSYPNSAVINTSASTGSSAYAQVVDSDSTRKTIKFVIGPSANRANAIKQVLKNANIDVAPDATGDIKVLVGGTEGATGEFTIAKVVSPVTASLSADPANITIGTQDQAVSDVTIKEAYGGAIDYSSTQTDPNGNNIQLIFPEGVTPTVPTSVSVTDGDLLLDTSSVSRIKRNNDSRWVINIPVRSSSTKASTIKVSGLKITADRSVPVGNIDVQVGGSDLNETASTFGNYEGVTSFTAAKIATPAPADSTAQNIVFKLNSKTFTIDGKETTMDAAPLVAWDRAFLPVRFAANALNVSDDQIIWDDKTSTATIFNGSRVITARVGDKFLTVNGAKVAMDVPVYRSKAATNNRVMIPIRYLANALGATINWNQSTGEITINTNTK
ncbi:copper amine oxidase N-terminal domain-containing protein [Aneurinibacillus terranovensis]|uniref:copper amine oxidase N-terminal domain-containing protein n=1 Tax=Aneurinibacillus terranovensis TaxID=278991 RepID=UPI000418309E|nr:copper amine oxidase N-terminal domain-containing protein [Aneurinibacillus terranovensis]